MGHEIHHDDFKVTTSKERILAMVSARAERDGDYHEPITSIADVTSWAKAVANA